MFTRLASSELSRRSWPSLETLLALKMTLLIAAGAMAILWGGVDARFQQKVAL
jgi:preprotein translocase subunit SecE